MYLYNIIYLHIKHAYYMYICVCDSIIMNSMNFLALVIVEYLLYAIDFFPVAQLVLCMIYPLHLVNIALALSPRLS